MFTKNADDGSDEEAVARKFHGDSAGLDDVDDDYLDHGDGDYDEELDLIKFHSDVAGLDDIDDCDDYDDEEFYGMRFHSIRRNYERVRGGT